VEMHATDYITVVLLTDINLTSEIWTSVTTRWNQRSFL